MLKEEAVERNPDLGQKDFQILSAEIRLRRVPDLFQHIATRLTRLGVDASKGEVVISGLEVVLLLFGQL